MPKVHILIGMLIFGTIGLFVRNVDLAPEYIALDRALLGSLFIWLSTLVCHQPLNWAAMKENFPYLCASGLALGINWIFLFKAFASISIAVATILNYLAPVFVALLSPLILKEAFSKTKLSYVFVSLFGTTLICGLWEGNLGATNIDGIYYALIAAGCYTCIMFSNKFLKANLTALETTFPQIAIAGLAVAIYILFFSHNSFHCPNLKGILSLLTLGCLHTGLAFILFCGSMRKLPAQTIAIFCYIEPVTAILVSVFFLHEPFSLSCIIGTTLILGSTLLSQLRR